jgi:hypothetical protein
MISERFSLAILKSMANDLSGGPGCSEHPDPPNQKPPKMEVIHDYQKDYHKAGTRRSTG